MYVSPAQEVVGDTSSDMGMGLPAQRSQWLSLFPWAKLYIVAYRSTKNKSNSTWSWVLRELEIECPDNPWFGVAASTTSYLLVVCGGCNIAFSESKNGLNVGADSAEAHGIKAMRSFSMVDATT